MSRGVFRILGGVSNLLSSYRVEILVLSKFSKIRVRKLLFETWQHVLNA